MRGVTSRARRTCTRGATGVAVQLRGRPRAGGNADMSAAREVKRKTAVRGREAELKRDESTRERKRDVSGEKAAVIRGRTRE